jgi:hypothetical protein
VNRVAPIVKLATDEVVAGSLRDASSEALAERVPEYEAVARELSEALAAIRDELRRRVEERGSESAIFSGYEVTLAGRSEWDADELEGVARYLEEERGGLIAGFPLGDMFKRGKPIVVGTVANRLLKQLPGSERKMVEDCRTIRRRVVVRAPIDASAHELELEEGQA